MSVGLAPDGLAGHHLHLRQERCPGALLRGRKQHHSEGGGTTRPVNFCPSLRCFVSFQPNVCFHFLLQLDIHIIFEGEKEFVQKIRLWGVSRASLDTHVLLILELLLIFTVVTQYDSICD